MPEDLKFVVGADINELLQALGQTKKSLGDFKDQLGRFKTALDKATDPASVIRLNKAIEATQARIKTIQSSTGGAAPALDKFTKSSNNAALALNDLGRVAQDAPFGFIGIQNNLNPLLESFRRLRAETGSNVGALKALAGSLGGAGGIGLALSVASSAFLIYQNLTRDSTKETVENEKAIQLSISTYDKFLSEIEKTADAAGREAAKVSILFSALSDSNIGLRERKGIIEQLNQISPGYLGQLDKEKASYEQIAIAVSAYTESIAKNAEIKALLPQVEEIFSKLIKAQIELNQLRRFQTKSGGGLLDMSAEDFAAEEKNIKHSIEGFTKQIQQAKKGLEQIAGGALSLSEILFGKTPELEKKAKETKQTVEGVIANLRQQIALLNKEEIDFNTDKSKERFSAFEQAIKELVIKFNLSLKDARIEGLIDEAKIAKLGFIVNNGFLKLGIGAAKAFKDGIDTKLQVESIIEVPFSIVPIEKSNALNKQLKIGEKLNGLLNQADLDRAKMVGFLLANNITTGLQDGIDINVNGLRFPELTALYDSAKARLQTFKEGLNAIIQSTFQNGVISLAESIGNAIDNGSGLEGIFDSFFKVIATGLKDLGKYLIQTYLIVGAIKKIKFSNPAVGVALGAALVVLGAAIESRINRQKFATGGLIGGSGNRDNVPILAMPGEYVLRKSAVQSLGISTVENLNRGKLPGYATGGFINDGSSVEAGQVIIMIADNRISGNDIVTTYRRASATQGRVG